MTTTIFSIHLGRQKLGGPCPVTSYNPVFVKSDRAAQSTFHLRAKLNISMKSKVIHPKQYKHLKKAKAIWADKKWAGFWQISLYIK